MRPSLLSAALSITNLHLIVTWAFKSLCLLFLTFFYHVTQIFKNYQHIITFLLAFYKLLLCLFFLIYGLNVFILKLFYFVVVSKENVSKYIKISYFFSVLNLAQTYIPVRIFYGKVVSQSITLQFFFNFLIFFILFF